MIIIQRLLTPTVPNAKHLGFGVLNTTWNKDGELAHRTNLPTGQIERRMINEQRDHQTELAEY